MILDEIFDKIGRDSFFKSEDFGDNVGLSLEKSRELLEKAEELGLVINTSNDEYTFKDVLDETKVKEFEIYIEKNFVLGTRKKIHLNLEESELKDEVFHKLLARERGVATELLVRYIENNNTITSTRNDVKSEIYIWKDGETVPEGESYIKEFSRKILGSAYTTNLVNDVISKIRTDTFQDADEFYRKEQENKNEILIENGILNTESKELSIPNPRKIFFNRIPVKYDPSATCPNIDKFLSEVLKSPEDKKVFYEVIGDTLRRNYTSQTISILYGEGENGKGVATNLIKTFLGFKNCSAVHLSQLTPDSFSCSLLFGKLANIAGDLSSGDLKDTGRLKELSSGTDMISAKRKFLNDLLFINYAKLIFSLNELPRVYDLTHGFWRRLQVLDFPYRFLKQKEYNLLKDKKGIKLADPEIIKKITTPTELSGLLNKALNGLDRLRKNKQFSYTKSTAEVKDMWIRKSDSFTAFCYDLLEEDSEGYISKKTIRKTFNQFCKKYKVRGTSDKNIKVVLEDLFGVTESRKNTPEGFDNVWEGIKFNSNIKDYKGFSPYRTFTKTSIGQKTIEKVDNSSNSLKIIDFFKENPKRVINLKEIESFFPNPKQELSKLKERGLIFEPEESKYQFLG